MENQENKEKTAVEAEQEHRDEMNDHGFYAMHPFSRDREGIWDFNKVMWFTDESFAEACADV